MPLTVHSRSEFGSTPLHFAARLGEVEQIALLLSHGANVDAIGEDGATPLHDAAGNDMAEAAEALLAAGANATLKDDDGFTAAELARDMGAEATAELIEKRG